jgi:hypothetical protein
LLVAPAFAEPDPRTVADAYGSLSVFILNVAAGNDGESLQPDGEDAFKELFAQQVVDAYPSLSADDRQSLAVLAGIDLLLHQEWPTLPVEQRNSVRDEWAAHVQNMVADAPCELFDALARAQLLPSFGSYKQTNINRLRQCWHDQPELTHDSQERASAESYANGGSDAYTGGSHSTFMSMMNAGAYRYAASMNIASMGTATYTVKPYWQP